MCVCVCVCVCVYIRNMIIYKEYVMMTCLPKVSLTAQQLIEMNYGTPYNGSSKLISLPTPMPLGIQCNVSNNSDDCSVARLGVRESLILGYCLLPKGLDVKEKKKKERSKQERVNDMVIYSLNV